MVVAGIYQIVTIHRHLADLYYDDRAVPGLQICWEYGDLRQCAPTAQRRPDTSDSLVGTQSVMSALPPRPRYSGYEMNEIAWLWENGA